MLIDWFTVFAQAVNFLILVWLLKRFLYQPVLRAVDARENHISGQLREAENIKTQAQKAREDLQHEKEVLVQQREVLMSHAVGEAEQERQRLLEEARKEAQCLRSKLQEATESELANQSREIIRQTQHEIFSIARKALSDLASARLEEQTIEVFLRRLNELAPEEKAKLREEGCQPGRAAIVRSAFDLPPEQRGTVESAVRAILGNEVRIQFERCGDLISGIEFTTNGRKIAWSIADYLVEMEKSLVAIKDAEHANSP